MGGNWQIPREVECSKTDAGWWRECARCGQEKKEPATQEQLAERVLGVDRWSWGRAGQLTPPVPPQGERREHVLLLGAGPDPQRARGGRGTHGQPPAARPAVDGEGPLGRGQHREAAAGGEAAPVAAPAAGGLLAGLWHRGR